MSEPDTCFITYDYGMTMIIPMCIGRATFGDDRCTCETVVDLRPKEMIMKINKANQRL